MTELPGVPVHWMDLAVAGLLLWAGAAGWLRGWKGTAWRLAVLGAAFAAAVTWRGEFQAALAGRYPVEQLFRAVAASRLALPVSTQPGTAPDWSPLFREWLCLNPVLAVSGGAVLVDYLARALYNATAFAAALLLWGGTLHLAGLIFLDRPGTPETFFSRLAGFAAGLVRGSTAVILASGLAIPLLFLGEPAWQWCRLEQARVLQAAMYIFNKTGIWWQ